MAVPLAQLRAFVAIAEAGSIGLAAQVLGTTQPPLSRLLLRLERHLGVMLFERSNRGVELTPAAEALLPAARGVLASVQVFASTAGQVAQGRVGVLRVGTTEGAAPMISDALRLFAARMPQVHVRLTPGHTAAKLALLQARQLDVAFVRNPSATLGIETAEVWREPLTAVVSTDHPLAAAASTTLSALAPYPLMVTPHEVNAAVHAEVLALFQRSRVVPEMGPPMLSEADALTQIAAGHGWTLLTSAAAAATGLPLTKLVLDDTTATAAVTVAWRDHDTRPPVVAFIAAARQAGVHGASAASMRGTGK